MIVKEDELQDLVHQVEKQVCRKTQVQVGKLIMPQAHVQQVRK